MSGLTKKRKRGVLFITLGCIASLLALLTAFIFLSPLPVSFMIRAAFNKKIAVAPDNFKEMQNNVEVIKNLNYPSEYKDNFADIYIPKNQKNQENQENLFPVILWIHGGAFVGGDKEDIEIYATALASEGFAVVCINYRRAPEAKYPAPVIQTNDAYLWIKDIALEYSLDINNFILAGDSAGAHIAAQFAAVQSNQIYADEMGLAQNIPLHTLKSVLLFCGPYDVSEMQSGNNFIVDFLMGRAAWAYFGKKDWADDFSYQATISNHVTSDFPPAFISDGNNLSFEHHARALADTLKNKGVLFETYFIPAGGINSAVAAHEYQFIMNTPSGKESFNKAVAFLKERIR